MTNPKQGFENKTMLVPPSVLKKNTTQTKILKPKVLSDNMAALDQVLSPESYTADDRIFSTSVNSGYKNKKALDIRANWNNNGLKKYYDKELGDHESRIWWEDDDLELRKKHVII
jgi:hypothetical protein